MKEKQKQYRLVSEIATLQEEKALSLVKELLAEGYNPLDLVNFCQEGMCQVGQLYAQNKYSISGMIMGGEIFREAMELISPVILSSNSHSHSGAVLLGTVAGDVHDLGKNIVGILLKSINCEVHDLGVDVPPEEFVKQAKVIRPDIIGLSCLITVAFDSMRETIKQLKRSNIKAPIIIGGGQLSEEINKYIGADYWTDDATKGIKICQSFLTTKSKHDEP